MGRGGRNVIPPWPVRLLSVITHVHHRSAPGSASGSASATASVPSHSHNSPPERTVGSALTLTIPGADTAVLVKRVARPLLSVTSTLSDYLSEAALAASARKLAKTIDVPAHLVQQRRENSGRAPTLVSEGGGLQDYYRAWGCLISVQRSKGLVATGQPRQPASVRGALAVSRLPRSKPTSVRGRNGHLRPFQITNA